MLSTVCDESAAEVNRAMTSVTRNTAPPAAAVPSGTVTSISLSDTTVGFTPAMASAWLSLVSDAGSNSTVGGGVNAGSWNPDPKILIVLPPFSGPPSGSTEVITGAPNAYRLSPVSWGVLSTVCDESAAEVNRAMTSVTRNTAPPAAAVPSGTVTSISLSDTTVGFTPAMASAWLSLVSDAGSNSTVGGGVNAGSWNPDPKILIVLPPFSGPPSGSTEVITGAPATS